MPVRGVRRRYLALKIDTEEPLTEEKLVTLVNDKIHFLYGVTGSSNINSRLIEYNSDDNSAILRCNHNMLTEMRAVLAHISLIEGSPIRIVVERVSGTIRTLKKKMKE